MKEYAKTEGAMARQLQYRGENRDKIQKGQRVIYQRDKEDINIKRRAHYLANREAILEKMRGDRESLKQEAAQEEKRT